MALSVVDNRIVLNQCDSTTGWTATDGPALFTTSPDPIEVSGCLAMQVSNRIEDAYTTITSDDYSGGGSLSIWIQDRAAFVSVALVGQAIQVGDGTNRIGYTVGGSDGTAFRHDTGPVKWACFLLDLANKPANFVEIAGAEASLNEAAITQVGVYFETNVKSVGGTDNCFWDIIRYADPGVGIEVYGGTLGTPETLDTLAALDRADTNLIGALGIIRELGAGLYGIQGNINLGDPTTTNDTYIDIFGDVLTWEARNLSVANHYRWNWSGNSTGTTRIRVRNAVLTVANGANAVLNIDDANLTDCEITDSVVRGFDQGINSGGSNPILTSNQFIDCGQIAMGGSDLSSSSVSGYVGTTGTGAVFYNEATNPNTLIDGMSFTMGTTLTHAIEFGTSSSLTINLTNINFSGYNTTNGETTGNDAVLLFADTGADVTWTVNVSGGSGTISYKKSRATDTVNVVQNPVTTTITVVDFTTNSAIQGAAVYLTAGAGGPLTQGTIIINGTTDSAGQISDTRSLASNQPIGFNKVHKGSGSIAYVEGEGAIAGTIDSNNGFTQTVQLQID